MLQDGALQAATVDVGAQAHNHPLGAHAGGNNACTGLRAHLLCVLSDITQSKSVVS